MIGPAQRFTEIKANPGCTDGMARDMGLVKTSSKPVPAAMQPRIKAAAQPGYVRIPGSKDYADLVNIYLRVLGTVPWTLVGSRRQKFPFDDQTPLKTPGVAEQREYQARGIVGDDEVGLPSDIVQVTHAGWAGAKSDTHWEPITTNYFTTLHRRAKAGAIYQTSPP